MAVISVFVIDDNPTAMLAGLKNLFRGERDGIVISGHSEDIKGALDSSTARLSDVILMDLILNTSDPVSNIQKLRQKFPKKPVIVYTQNASLDWMKIMAGEGASGFISKSASREELKLAIERAMKGEVGFGCICGSSDDKNPFIRKEKLLKSVEREILLELVKQNSRKKVAEKFNLSRWELGRQIKNIKSRFKAGSDLELIKILTERKEI